MNSFINLDLLSVGITVAGIGILGFTVFFNNTKSITNKSFLLFSLVSVFWGIANYLNYKFSSEIFVLWTLRILIFLATWHAFSLLQLLYVFPKEEVNFSKSYKYILLPIVVIISLITLTPLAFVKIINLAPVGEVSTVSKGPGMLSFIVIVIFLIVKAFYILLRKINKSEGIEKKQAETIFLGLLVTFFLLFIFNFILPALFDQVSLIPLGALFLLPFVFATAYSIYKHRLFNIKVAATAFVAFLLTVFSFVNVINSADLVRIIINTTAFIVILLGSIELIKAMLNLEVANDQQASLMHFMNHQIKGRFGNAKNIFAELMAGDYGTMPAETVPLLQKGLDETDTGINYVQGILKGASAESGQLPYDMKLFDLKPILEDVAKKQRESAEKKGLKFNLTIEPGNYSLMGDALQLSEAMKNLIDNSINYTPSGSVDVTLFHNINLIRLKVKDNGIGISPEDKDRLFKAGGRGTDSLKINTNATGYGLVFVKGVVEAHKGRVWVESLGRGKGSTFFMELPKN